ncbi:hypothetical protein [Flavobacterium sp.]|uniref:hypothetical protein n=1 Tax=Flavobacterium sp. TaxID=239 RepID=UPI0032631FD5
MSTIANRASVNEVSQSKPDGLELFRRILQDVFKTNGYDRESEKTKLKMEIGYIDKKIEVAAMKNLQGVWDDSLFLKTKGILDNQKSQAAMTLNALNKFEPEFNTYLSNSTTLFANLTL